MDKTDVSVGKIKFILNIYGNPSYFDLYGTQFVIFIIITFLEVSFLIIMNLKKNAAFYKLHWSQVRCNPAIMPFAGFINKPDGTSISKYTEENYQYCIGQSMDNTMDVKFSPLLDMENAINDGISLTNKSLAASAEKTNLSFLGANTSIQSGTNVLYSIFSILEIAFVFFMDILLKTVGLFTTSGHIIKSGLGWFTMMFELVAIALSDFIAVFYAATVYPTIPYWIFIWPILYFILFLVMFVIAEEFKSWVVMIGDAVSPAESFTNMNRPRPLAYKMLNFKLSKISLCFDKNTKLKTPTGFKKIKRIVPGDMLETGMVTSTFKTLVISEMFNLNGIIVSGDHRVLLDSKWVKVKNHPDSKLIDYRKKYLYCINTTGKTIATKNHIFMDWDELGKKKLKTVLNYLNTNVTADIHKLDNGFSRNYRVKTINGYKRICNIIPGDILEDNIRVLATVKIKGDDLGKQLFLYHLVTDKGYFKNHRDYNYIIDKLFYIS